MKELHVCIARLNLYHVKLIFLSHKCNTHLAELSDIRVTCALWLIEAII